MKQYIDTVTDERSNLPVPDAAVYVYNDDATDADAATLATLYASDGTTEISNPLTTDAQGEYSFYQDTSEFTALVYYGGRLRRRLRLLVGGGYSAASQAAAAAALAAAGVGEYASTAAGLAATSLGETFWVDQGDGTGQVYRHDTGPVATALNSFILDPTDTGAAAIFAGGVPRSAALSASDGAALVGFSQADTFANGTAGSRFKQEVWVTDAPYNADATGATDASAAIAAAITALPATGGTIRFGPGTFKANFTLPAEPKVVNVIGSGFGATKLIQNTADTPIIKKVAGVSRIIGAALADFTVIPHASSLKAEPANVLIDIAGFDWSSIDIDYEANSASTATAGRAHAVVAAHANGIPCYNNSISLKMAQTNGPEKGVWLHNNGGNSLHNPNVTSVSVWTYALDACDIAVDAADSTQTTVRDGLFEDCPGMTGVIAGNFTKTQGNWFELIDVAINYGETSDTTANNCVSSHDQFSGANTIVIHSNVAAPPRFDAPLFGTMTFENQSAAASTNYVLPTVAKTTPATPTISWLLIGVTLVSTDILEVRFRPDHHGVITTAASYIVTPLGTGRDALSITPPAGYEIMTASVGIEEIGVAVRPVALSADPAGKNYIVYWPNTNNHQVNVRVTMRAV